MTPRTSSAIAQTTLRVALGSTLVAHGTQKLFGWFGGVGLPALGDSLHELGFHPGRVHAALAGLTEAGAGAALALGFATPAAGAGVAITMGVAAGVNARNGFFASKQGLEYPAILALAAAAAVVEGSGPASIDALTGHVLDRPWMRAVGLTAIPLVVGLQFARRGAVLRRIRAAHAPDGIGDADAV